MTRRTRGLLVALLATGLAAGIDPALASAHGFSGRTDLAIPKWVFAWGAAAVLVVSFVGLATLWPKPRLERATERELFAVPRVLEPVCGAIGVFLFGVTLYAGFDGSQISSTNWAPTFIYVIFWVGLAFASALFGDVFRVFNPWRAIARTVGWGLARTRSSAPPEPLPYPAWLGRWPAALGLLCFCVLELAVPETSRQDPSTLATYGAVYAAIQLVGMSIYGVEPWTDRADGFSVYFNLLSRLSPLRWRDHKAFTRPLLSGVTSLELIPGTVAVLVVMIGTTSFDGFSQGPTWRSLGVDVQNLFMDAGLSQADAIPWSFFVGLLAVVGVIGLFYRLGILGIHSVDTTFDTPELGRRFVHSLVPIALAYVVAHYFSYLIVTGANIIYLSSDPLGDGANLLGTAAVIPNTRFLTNNLIWYVQVGALLLGHIGGLVLAHDRALTLYDSPRVATRSQYWMLAVMVAFTSLGLWLLSAQGT